MFNQVHDNESQAPPLLWWPVGSLAFAVFGVVIIRLYKGSNAAVDPPRHIRINEGRIDVGDLISSLDIDPSKLRSVVDGEGIEILRVRIPVDLSVPDINRTFTLDDGETYYLFRTSECCFPSCHGNIPF